MTDTQQTESTGSELDPVIAGALTYRLVHPAATLSELAAQVVPVAAPAPVPQARPFPALPKQDDLSKVQAEALALLPEIFNQVRVKVRRQLTKPERAHLMQETETLDVIIKMATDRKEAIKELARTSMDVQAEAEGRAFAVDTGDRRATPRDQFGHYLLAGPERPQQLAVGETAWSQEYAQGSALPAAGLLDQAHKDGLVSREEFLGFTRAVRVLDEDNARAFIGRNPSRGLAVLRMITRRTEPTSRLNIRKAK